MKGDGSLATRLTLVPSDRNEDFVTIPGLAGGAVGTKYDWNTSYSANDALGGRVVPIPQGKIVGGSTKLNRMVFDRGSKSDYNAWESFGNSGWNFEGILPYFKKVNLNFLLAVVCCPKVFGNLLSDHRTERKVYTTNKRDFG